jgi:DNA-binding transcriptional ArsR family regulator
MIVEPDVSRIARTIGDPTRIRMLTLLMEGRALTAKELAHGTSVKPATATAHLRRLLADALVVSTPQGRHKYFRLASPQVAQCVEALLVVAVPAKAAPATPPHPIQQARFCYDHLAGRLSILITEALLKRDLLRLNGKSFVVTGRGERWFAKFGIDLPALAGGRRKFAYACLDWSERKDHLGGALGAAVAQRMLEAGWLRRRPGTRIATVTRLGGDALGSHFGIHWG